ncbi:uncharacterized protein YktB (UPF0637 family) [Weissella uvarum]|uniref:DUF1054 family protein n=1 Tax=Weissella uvarum TaxID=1479233 RepID=UPI00196152AD|nr:DUF1054 family protein [Weissella uvarum]MBM7617972.1 uncharacterized protein YktB (UPF0637 family) [Weissella uvarum]MCM0596191.1 DUF1054 family protein [Weissella uvarum]
MFEEKDFDVFNEPTLEGRMTAIRNELDPKFETFAQQALPVLEQDGQTWYAHVAKHLRRTVYPPENTWVALAPNKRGYKMLPHFELGFWDDRLYLYLSCLENLKKDAAATSMWAERLAAIQPELRRLPDNFVISPNHMEKPVMPLNAANSTETIENYAAKKHTEFSVGLNVMRDDTLMGTTKLDDVLLQTITALLPIYERLRD